jgi:hypothetical protein
MHITHFVNSSVGAEYMRLQNREDKKMTVVLISEQGVLFCSSFVLHSGFWSQTASGQNVPETSKPAPSGTMPEKTIPTPQAQTPATKLPQTPRTDALETQKADGRGQDVETMASKQQEIDDVATVHTYAVAAVKSGHRLDEQVPTELQQDAMSTFDLHSDTKKLTYSKVIRLSEDQFKELALEPVVVSVRSTPKKCSIRYRPVIGVIRLDAGTTDIPTLKLERRFYEFTCQCGKSEMSQTIDCNSAQNVFFRCPRSR